MQALLWKTLAHLQLNGDSIAERNHRGEGAADGESPPSGRVLDTSIEETESDTSSDTEVGPAVVGQHSLTQQRPGSKRKPDSS